MSLIQQLDNHRPNSRKESEHIQPPPCYSNYHATENEVPLV
jgi:hypothetical protein